MAAFTSSERLLRVPSGLSDDSAEDCQPCSPCLALIDSAELCGNEGGLRILDEFKRVYENRVREIDQDPDLSDSDRSFVSFSKKILLAPLHPRIIHFRFPILAFHLSLLASTVNMNFVFRINAPCSDELNYVARTTISYWYHLYVNIRFQIQF